MTMAKLMFGKLSEAWKGEATDFTPLLADQLDNLGDALGIDLAAVGKSDVLTTGGRRIDIVAQGEDGSEFVTSDGQPSAAGTTRSALRRVAVSRRKGAA